MTNLVKDIKKMLADEDIIIDPKRDTNLNKYIVAKAAKVLNSKHGALSDETVLSWARHFYLELQEDIDKELKSLPKTQGITSKSTKEKNEPKPQKSNNDLKMYNDKGKVVKAVQESLFG